MFGEMEGKTKRERPRREWLDDVNEWCNEEIYILKRKAQDRDAWKKQFNLHWTPTDDEPMECWMDGIINSVMNERHLYKLKLFSSPHLIVRRMLRLGGPASGTLVSLT